MCRRLNRLAVTSARSTSSLRGWNEFSDKKGKIKRAEEKRKEHLREVAEEKKTRKRRKEERRRSFFRNLSVALGSTSSVGRARSLYSFLVLKLVVEEQASTWLDQRDLSSSSGRARGTNACDIRSWHLFPWLIWRAPGVEPSTSAGPDCWISWIQNCWKWKCGRFQRRRGGGSFLEEPAVDVNSSSMLPPWSMVEWTHWISASRSLCPTLSALCCMKMKVVSFTLSPPSMNAWWIVYGPHSVWG